MKNEIFTPHKKKTFLDFRDVKGRRKESVATKELWNLFL
jgi:hypothetical protein